MVKIDGKEVAKKVLEDLKQKVQKLDKKPSLAVILAGDDPSSKVYVASKEKCSLALGYKSCVYRFWRIICHVCPNGRDGSLRPFSFFDFFHKISKYPLTIRRFYDRITRLLHFHPIYISITQRSYVKWV